MIQKHVGVITVCALSLALCSSDGARANLVINGSFEDTSNVTPPPYPGNIPGTLGVGGIGGLGYNTVATGWTSPETSYTNQTGYNFIFSPATASSTGSNGYNGGLALWGPGNGFNNGLTASPDGGQFVGADGDTRYNGRIQQTITGLTVGGYYQVGFWWALAQEAGNGGTPTAQWQVSLGSDTQSTPNVNLPSVGGFVPWMYQTLNFTATSTSEVLSFLATEGGPFGGPPFLLLDGVSLNAVPEPSSLLTAGVGISLFGIGAARRLRGRSGSAA